MKIAIVGAGAMGCLYGAKLSAVPEHEVYLLDVWKEHIDAINRDGLKMEEGDDLLVYDRVRGCIDAADVGPVDLAIVFVKSTLTEQAVESNAAVFGENTVVLTLQNGLGNIEKIAARAGEDSVIAGTTAHGATMLGPGKMRHAGVGKTVIGELDGSATPRVAKVKAALEVAGMETDISDNVLGLVWDKLLVNVGINALTGITGLENGRLLDYPELETLLEDAVREGAAVAEAKGIRLIARDPVAHTKEVARATAANRSSMLQDVTNGKKTEIEMINGAIAREGAAAGVATPINGVLTRLIQFAEARGKEVK